MHRPKMYVPIQRKPSSDPPPKPIAKVILSIGTSRGESKLIFIDMFEFNNQIHYTTNWKSIRSQETALQTDVRRTDRHEKESRKGY